MVLFLEKQANFQVFLSLCIYNRAYLCYNNLIWDRMGVWYVGYHDIQKIRKKVSFDREGI